MKKEHIYNRPEFGDETEQWFTYPKLYTEMVNTFPSDSTFVEVGAFKGKSSSYMAVEIANSKKKIDFYVVDIWSYTVDHFGGEVDVYDLYLKNTNPVKKYIKPLKMNSVKASKQFADNSIDFLFLDAGHEYEDLFTDIDAWYSKVKPGGIVAGHDYYPENPSWGGVYAAMNDMLADGTIPNLAYYPDDCFIIYKK